MDAEELDELRRTWSTLTLRKRMPVKKVYDRVPKDRISAEDLKKPEVAEEVQKFGFYDVKHVLSDKTVKALELLTALGYLEKRTDTFYQVGYVYEAHPYVPYISPFGSVAIKPNTKFHQSHRTFDSGEYKIFQETAMIFKNQLLDKMHKHITIFNYGLEFSYETTVYELKDRYFDAFTVGYAPGENKLIVHLAEPYVTSDGKRDVKHHKQLEEIPQDVFLAGSVAVDHFVDRLEWKKKSIGVVVRDDETFFIVPKEVAEEEEERHSVFQMPDFFDKGLYSPENFFSRVFEDSVAHYLKISQDYEAEQRVKPDYLNGGEIDVFAEKGVSPKKIMVCECKLRFEDAPINMDEITYFQTKAEKIRQNESKRGNVSFDFWFVTNTDKLAEGVKAFASEHKIELKNARLTSGWKKRADFKVEEIRAI